MTLELNTGSRCHTCLLLHPITLPSYCPDVSVTTCRLISPCKASNKDQNVQKSLWDHMRSLSLSDPLHLTISYIWYTLIFVSKIHTTVRTILLNWISSLWGGPRPWTLFLKRKRIICSWLSQKMYWEEPDSGGRHTRLGPLLTHRTLSHWPGPWAIPATLGWFQGALE